MLFWVSTESRPQSVPAVNGHKSQRVNPHSNIDNVLKKVRKIFDLKVNLLIYYSEGSPLLFTTLIAKMLKNPRILTKSEKSLILGVTLVIYYSGKMLKFDLRILTKSEKSLI